jgi:hypothetical protein
MAIAIFLLACGFCAPFRVNCQLLQSSAILPAQDRTSSAPTAESLSTGAANKPDSIASESGIPRCDEIAGIGPNFGPLASACAFALSRRNLPNYICQENTERFVNDRLLDVVTADVTFINGRYDRYANLAINGHPAASLRGTGGWVSAALFGNQLTTIFSPGTETHFEFRREINTGPDPLEVYAFSFKRENNTTFFIGEVYPGLSGSITVNKANGQLQRIDANLSDAAPQMWFDFYKSFVNFGETAIPDLGRVLVPLDGEVRACGKGGTCYRNVLRFHDCRKFTSTARIVPNAESLP